MDALSTLRRRPRPRQELEGGGWGEGGVGVDVGSGGQGEGGDGARDLDGWWGLGSGGERGWESNLGTSMRSSTARCRG